MAVLLVAVIALPTFALYTASTVFYLAAREQITTCNELQYALMHIYKYVMQGIGDTSSAAIEVPDSETLVVYLDTNSPTALTPATYGAAYRDTYTYTKTGTTLEFNDGATTESLIPKVTVTDVTFALDGNRMTVSLTGYYKDSNEPMTFYSSCYPRLASFQ
jgi:hypothetical protein